MGVVLLASCFGTITLGFYLFSVGRFPSALGFPLAVTMVAGVALPTGFGLVGVDLWGEIRRGEAIDAS